ncbi:hypothetical protein LSH36_301g03030 [Paralvinella palmiformis]|uniref:Uncharacterized protein n=1 Tax=Paralvinella palmiformis TaxID=53620 RepID=A0AAD9N1I9_9ANNE|nr:hypothetical protein LSH36_301g03030 [Paralvinella palmiformis]
MLHPIYCVRNLHPEHIETAQEYVLEENLELLPELCHLQTGGTLPKNLQRSRKNMTSSDLFVWFNSKFNYM